jgi:hypothetical protein
MSLPTRDHYEQERRIELLRTIRDELQDHMCELRRDPEFVIPDGEFEDYKLWLGILTGRTGQIA